eukprot:1791108-Pyramimonas_sp.AAC.1
MLECCIRKEWSVQACRLCQRYGNHLGEADGNALPYPAAICRSQHDTIVPNGPDRTTHSIYSRQGAGDTADLSAPTVAPI